MAVKTEKELFVLMLSDLRQGTEKAKKILDEIGKNVEEPEIEEALQARAFVNENVLRTLDQCFTLIDEQPVKVDGHVYETFLEDFRRELAEIKNPTVRRLFVLAKVSQVVHFRIAEYKVLIAAADLAGHYGVGVLLETALADKLALVERTERLIRQFAEVRIAERIEARSAAA
jgi:ferritin-like metal-binding protein YciE